MSHILFFITLVIVPMATAGDDTPAAGSETDSPAEKAAATAEDATPASDAATSSPDKRFVEVGVKDITATHRAQPRWPASGAGKEGTACDVTLYVDATGTPERAVSVCGLSQFERAATSAGMKWRFEPHLVDGKATPFKYTLKLKFTKK